MYTLIADEASKKIPIRVIVQNVHSLATNDEDPLLTFSSKDVHNLTSTSIVKEGRYHRDDAISSTMAAQELIRKYEVAKRSSIVKFRIAKADGYYWENGVTSLNPPSIDTVDGMAASTFILSPPYQFAKLLEHGKGVIGVDTTHDASRYGHLLTTVVVQDERKEGLPVAFCLSTKKDAVAYTKFFEALREKAGIVQPAYFISDGDLTIYSAWERVMGPVGQPRLCLWHVKKSWGEKMKQLRIDRESIVGVELKKQLDMLIEEPERAE